MMMANLAGSLQILRRAYKVISQVYDERKERLGFEGSRLAGLL